MTFHAERSRFVGTHLPDGEGEARRLRVEHRGMSSAQSGLEVISRGEMSTGRSDSSCAMRRLTVVALAFFQ
jgi:hypothetical protein